MIPRLTPLAGFVLASLALAACGPRPGTCPPMATAENPPLITLEEHTEDGRCIPVPKSGVAELDVNSTIELRMNKPAIKERMLSQAATHVETRAKDLDKQLSLLASIVEARSREVEYLTALIAEIHQLDPSVRARRVMAFGKLRGAFRKAVGEYAALIDAPKADFLRPESGDALIQKHLKRAQEESQNLVANLQGVSWRVEAALDKDGGQAQLHVENYDQLKAGTVRRFDKMSPVTPEIVAQQFEKAVTLSKQVEALRRDTDSLSDMVLQQLTARFREISSAALADIQTAATDLKTWKATSQRRARASVQSFADTLQRTLQPVYDLPEACELMRDLATGAVTPDASLLARLPEFLTCIEAVDAVLDIDTAELISAAKGVIGLIPEQISSGVAALRAAHETLTGKASAWRRATEFISSQKSKLGAEVWSSKNLNERGASELVDGRIELMRSRRVPGDLVHVRASVVEDDEVLETTVTRTVRVVSAGMRLDIGPALLFIDPLNDDDSTAPAESFRATPAVSAVLHYRAWRDDGEHRGNRLWNFFDPGIGIHVAYLDLGNTERDDMGNLISTDPTTEIGVGGVLNLFGDLVQVGAGYNLQVRRPYWFLGFGLKSLTDFGLTVPGGL